MPQGEHNFERLKEHILPLSRADTFERPDTNVEMHEGWDNCPCGKDIKELCYMKSRLTHEETYVGHVCVNRFIGIETGNLFAGLKLIAADETANANTDLESKDQPTHHQQDRCASTLTGLEGGAQSSNRAPQIQSQPAGLRVMHAG